MTGMMKKDIREEDVIHLLERLKGQESAYPSALQEQRRAAFLALGVVSLPHGAGLGHIAGEAAAPTGQAASLPMTLGMKITLGLLSTAIVGLSTYLGMTVYENRDALRDLLHGGTPTIALISPPPNPSGTPAFATPAFLSTGTPTGTPTPPGTLVSSTPEEINPVATPTKPGWHYGQTRTPKPKKP